MGATSAWGEAQGRFFFHLDEVVDEADEAKPTAQARSDTAGKSNRASPYENATEAASAGTAKITPPLVGIPCFCLVGLGSPVRRSSGKLHALQQGSRWVRNTIAITNARGSSKSAFASSCSSNFNGPEQLRNHDFFIKGCLTPLIPGTFSCPFPASTTTSPACAISSACGSPRGGSQLRYIRSPSAEFLPRSPREIHGVPRCADCRW